MTSPQRVAYSAVTDRPPLRWPDDNRLALWVCPNIEHYEYLPPIGPVRDPYPRTPHPDVLSYGGKDYGNRVGFWRMLEVFDRHGIRGSVSLNLSVPDHYPEVFEACEARNWDYMGHGLYNTRYVWGVSEDEERAMIQDCVARFRSHTGRQLGGWFSPALSHTWATPDLVAEAGIRYYCDWFHDDQPFPMRVRDGQLITVPYSVDLNDAVCHRQGYEAEDFARMIRETFDVLYREGGQVMCIAVHPYWIGQPHRIGAFDEALRYILGHEGVWKTTGGEIADWYYAQYYDAVVASLEAENR